MYTSCSRESPIIIEGPLSSSQGSCGSLILIMYLCSRCCYAFIFHTVLTPSLDQQLEVRSKMVDLRQNCQLLISQVSNMKTAASATPPDTEVNSSLAPIVK